jgi:ribulose-5-phosphate 4-epimerase/fuculose-1-phosphate aldolase
MGMDDRTYTHLSARVPGEEAYYIYPLGLLFEEVTPDKLNKVDLEGNILEGEEVTFNQTGYVIHSSVYKARPEINAVFHVHTIDGVAVSCMRQGLLPLSQFSLHFYNRLAYHDYTALTLDAVTQGEKLAGDLGPTHKAMILRNHGTMTCGETSQEALFYMLFLEEACKVQVAALSAGIESLSIPPKDVCEKAYHGMTAFEKGEVGQRDFDAMCRVTTFPWHG